MLDAAQACQSKIRQLNIFMLLGCNHRNSGELYLCKSASQHKLAVFPVGGAAAGICVLTLQFNVIQSDFLAASIPQVRELSGCQNWMAPH